MPLSLGIEIEGIAVRRSDSTQSFPIDENDQFKIIVDAIIASSLKARTSIQSSPQAAQDTHDTWTVVHDATLMEATSEESNESEAFATRFSFELISPVFLNAQQSRWERELRLCVGAVSNVIVWKVNRSTGYHVHVSRGLRHSFILREVKKIAMLQCRFEAAMDTLHPEHRIDNDNIESNRNNDKLGNLPLNTVYEKIRDAQDNNGVCALVNHHASEDYSGQSDSRFFKVNFTSLQKHGTIEFRQHQGTVDVAQMVKWTRFVLKFVNYAITHSFEAVTEDDDSLEKLSELVGRYE